MVKDNKNRIIKRVGVIFLLLASIFFLPWWVTVMISVLVSVFFEKPYEIIVAGGIMDILYPAPLIFFLFSNYFFTIVFLALFLISYYFKEKIIF